MQELICKYLRENPKALLVVWAAAQLGSWIIGLPSWRHALTTQAIGSLLLGLGAVAGAAGASSVLKGVNDDGKN
jgi:hypothetical protein